MEKERRKDIDSIIQNVFVKFPLQAAQRKKLREIAASLFIRDYDIFLDLSSGIVIAGYGDEEVFPSMQVFMLEGIVKSHLKIVQRESSEISYKTLAQVMAFAQSEMVSTFMEGVDPQYQKEIDSLLYKLISNLPQVIIDNIQSLGPEDKKDLKKKFEDLVPRIQKNYREQLKSYRKENFTETITKLVEHLPKSELAKMAEALVSLTSLKREVSLQAETVSGPIDVAVISKGDGFIWIKRKHYFSSELNPYFMANYYREDGE